MSDKIERFGERMKWWHQLYPVSKGVLEKLVYDDMVDIFPELMTDIDSENFVTIEKNKDTNEVEFDVCPLFHNRFIDEYPEVVI